MERKFVASFAPRATDPIVTLATTKLDANEWKPLLSLLGEGREPMQMMASKLLSTPPVPSRTGSLP